MNRSVSFLNAGRTAEEQITGKGEFGGLQIIAYPMKRETFERRFPKGPRILATCQDMMLRKLSTEMGLGAGGRMRQEIYEDPFDFKDWDRSTSSRCFVHIANSLLWRAITNEEPPTTTPTAKEYTAAGLPWFDYYNEGSETIEGSDILKQLRSVIALEREQVVLTDDMPDIENEPIGRPRVVRLGKKHSRFQVREGMF